MSGWGRGIVEFGLDLVPLAPSSRRAIGETLADWAHEANAAPTALGRMRASVVGACAVVGALARIAFRETRTGDAWRIFGWAVALGLVLAVVQTARLALLPGWKGAGLATASTLLFLIPQAFATGLALAFLTPRTRGRAGGVLGAVVLAMILSTQNLEWGVPTGNQGFREAAWRETQQQIGRNMGALPERGDAERGLLELVRIAASEGDATANARRALAGRAVVVFLLPACLLVGIQSRRVIAAAGARRGAGLLAWGVFVACTVGEVWAAGWLGDAVGVTTNIWFDLSRHAAVLLGPLLAAVLLHAVARHLEARAAHA